MEHYDFSKTRTVVSLFAVGREFVSRSEAKRLLHGLEQFREVVLDFEGLTLVGQGFERGLRTDSDLGPGLFGSELVGNARSHAATAASL